MTESARREVWVMDFIERIEPSQLRDAAPIAESEQFALYALEEGAYLIVQRHAGTPWTALRISGDGVFRVGGLVIEAMRHLYRNVASQLSATQGMNAERRDL